MDDGKGWPCFCTLLKQPFLSCRNPSGWLSAYLPCFHGYQWFLSSPPWTISLQTEILFNLSLSFISTDQHQHLFHSCSIFIRECNACWSLNPNSTYCTKSCRGKEDGRETLERKRKVLYLVSQWMELCNDFLRDDERVKLFMKVRDGLLRQKLGNRRHEARSENWCFLPDSVQLRAGWPFWAPGPGKGCEGAAETLHAASPTVSDCAVLFLCRCQSPDTEMNT